MSRIARGQTNVRIAFELDLVEQTIKNRLSVLLGYFNVSSRIELVLRTIKDGILSIDSVLPDPTEPPSVPPTQPACSCIECSA